MLFASDITAEAAALLNDQARAFYTDVNMLPHLKKSNEDLELILIASGAAVQRQESSTPIQVPVNVNNQVLTGIPDMFVPIRVIERASGSSDVFVLLDERAWEPNIRAASSLGYWTFRNNQIIFPPVSTAREVKVDYWRQLSPILNASSVEEILLSKTYLASRLAELCARYVGQNSEIADSLRDNEVSQAQDKLETIYVKNTQGSRSRRRRFSRSRTTLTR